MSIRFQCPSCQTFNVANDDMSGKKVRCRECKEAIAVPGGASGIVDKKGALPGASRVASRADDDDRPASRSSEGRRGESGKPAKKKSGAMVLVLVLLGIGVVGVLGFGVVILGCGGLFYFGTSSKPADPVIAANPGVPKAEGPKAEVPKFDGPRDNPDQAKPPVNPPIDPKAPLPDKIADAMVHTVKGATAYLQVSMQGGGNAEGTGFFAIEPGIVVTNAHVVGMMTANSPTPDNVDVVVNSGEPNQAMLRGTVLGVDRVTDLAIIRVVGNGVPAPLPVESASNLKDLQKLYYFGFPGGKQLGTNITIAEAQVASMRKNSSGVLEQVQLTGNMQPGNSGGPVVDSAGRVVGVARAIIAGTGINFAIPADKIKQILNGRVADTTYGEPYVQGNASMLPLSVQCLDPLGRIRSMKVEVWAGNTGPDRPFAYQKPADQPGDGPRQQVNVTYQNGTATADLPLPALGAGQVVWVQPVLTDGQGVTHWHTASAVTVGAPLQRIPATLQLKFDQAGERTVTVKYSEGVTIYEGKRKITEGLAFDANLLEAVTPKTEKGTSIRVTIGGNQFAEEFDGKKVPLQDQYHKRLSTLSPNFIVDASGKMLIRTVPKLSPKLNAKDKDILEGMLQRVCNAYEEGILIMPNRALEPMQTWQASIPNFVGKAPKIKVVDINLTFTYLGTRTTNGRQQAVINLVGQVKSRDKGVTKPMGKATGRAVFDIEGGYIAESKMRIASEHDFGGNVQFVVAENVEHIREPGNKYNITAIVPPKQPDPPAAVKGKVIFNVTGQITPKDQIDPEKAGIRYNFYDVALDAGKTYIIDMKQVPGTMVDPYLKLFDPQGKKIAEDDDGGGNLDARISYKAMATGRHRIIAESFKVNTYGGYTLTVTAIDGDTVPKGNPKGDPKGNVFDGKAQGFEKPAKSAMPTSYLKIVSTPGDFIGGGKSYQYAGPDLTVKKTPRGVEVRVDGWMLFIGAPQGQFLQAGEYRDAKRYAFSNESPGLDFFGKGRGSNNVAGEFVVWELAVEGEQITRLAIDFVQRSEGKQAPLTGKLRINSSLE